MDLTAAQLERLAPKEAVALQRRLAGRVLRRPTPRRVTTVGGVDIAVRGGRARAAAVVLAYPTLELLEERTAVRPLRFPYVPGLLSFREIPAVLEALAKLPALPDVILVDGHGIAHPRRFGIASHLGVELDHPTIGCAKSRLVGTHREPGRLRGARVRLTDRGEVIGTVLRTRTAVRPVFVSIGHRTDLEGAVRIALRCAPRYRLPEPTRAADRLAGQG